MKKSLALAAALALSVSIAACGDDDDDAAGDDTTAIDDAVTVADDAVTAAPAGGTDPSGTPAAGTDAAGTAPAASLTGDDAETLADCQALSTALSEPLTAPAVGEEITDEYRDQLEAARESIEGLDLSTDDADSARDAFVDMIDQIADADTMTEELQNLEENLPEDMIEFGRRCDELLGAGG